MRGLKVFTRGIDSAQLQLLCRSSDSNISLDDIQWTSIPPPSLSLHNPFIVSTLSDGIHYLQCNRGSDTSFTSNIVVQGTLSILDQIYILKSNFSEFYFIYRISYPNDY